MRAPRILIGIAALGAAVALTACSSGAGGGGGGSASGAPVSLSMTVLAAPAGSPYGKMATEYSRTHPGVTITSTEVPVEQIGQTLSVQLQGGNAPDMFYVTGGSGFDNNSVIPLAKAGLIVDLSGTPAEKLLNDSTRALYDFDGKVYAQPLDNVAYTTNYNMTAAKAAGITPPTTLAQVTDDCRTATKAGISLFALAGTAPQNTGLLALEVAASTVYRQIPDWDTQKADGKVTFAGSDEWKQTLQTIIDLQKAGCFQPDAAGTSIANNTPNVVAGRVLASFSPTGSLGDMVRLDSSKTFQAHVFPGKTASATSLMVAPSNGLAVNAKSSPEKRKAALAFLAWLAQPKNADQTAELAGNISITADSGSRLPSTFQALQPYIGGDAATTQVLHSLVWPNPSVYTDLGIGVQGLLTGQASIEQVLQKLDQDWG